MKKTIPASITVTALCMLCSVRALALSESEVEAAVAAQGKEAVSGNLIIWFLCAIAFLKVSTKLDSFMQALGLGVGRPQGSLLTEALMALRGFDAAGSFFGRGIPHPRGSGAGEPGGLQGGLAGAIGQRVESQTAGVLGGTAESGLSSTIGAQLYSASLGKDGGFASRVIGSVATGQNPGVISGEDAVKAMEGYFAPGGDAAEDVMEPISSTADGGEATTDYSEEPIPTAPLALDGDNTIPVSPGINAETSISTAESSDMIPTSPGIQQAAMNRVLQGQMGNRTAGVEMGGGKITGREIIPGQGQIQFAMYNAKQFERPAGHHTVQTSRDGEKWYKVYAKSGVERTPTVKDDNGRYQYEERKVAVMPQDPKRRR